MLELALINAIAVLPIETIDFYPTVLLLNK